MKARIKAGQRWATAAAIHTAGDLVEVTECEYHAHPWVFEPEEEAAARAAATRIVELTLHPDRAREFGLHPLSAAPQKYRITRLDPEVLEEEDRPAQRGAQAAAPGWLEDLAREELGFDPTEDTETLPEFLTRAVKTIHAELLRLRGLLDEERQRSAAGAAGPSAPSGGETTEEGSSSPGRRGRKGAAGSAAG